MPLVTFPSTAVELIIGPQLKLASPENPFPFFDEVQKLRGVFHGTNFPATPPTATDKYMNDQYYDLGLCLYALYYRSGDPAHLAFARKVTDSWWQFSPIGQGSAPLPGLSPRNSSVGGLMLRALDGRPEMWEWIQGFTRHQFDIWVKRYIGGDRLGYGVRDGAYMLQYATWCGKVLPDTYATQRAQFLADAENAAINYYVKLQRTDGSWRWDDSDNVPQPDGGFLRGIMQPFMVGLLLHSLIDVYRASSSATVKAAIKTSVLKCVDHFYDGGVYMKHNAGIAGSSVRWRAFHYLFHGGTTVNPTKYEKGDYYGINAPNIYSVEGARQTTSTLLHAFGWAYKETGDPKYSAMCDDLGDSIFGFKEDQISNYVNGTDPKGYNQHFRAAGRLLAYRFGSGAPAPVDPPAGQLTCNAGPNETLAVGATQVALVGTASGGTQLTTTWSKVAGPSGAVITDASKLSTQATGLLTGTYLFRLSANDGVNTVISDKQVIVPSVALPPPPPSGTRYVSGSVKKDGGPAAGVRITAHNASGAETAFMLSTTLGTYIFDVGTAAGSVRAPAGYTPSSYPFEAGTGNLSGKNFVAGAVVPPPPPPIDPPTTGPPIGDVQKGAWPSSETAQEIEINKWWAKGYRLKTTKVTGAYAMFVKEK